MVPLPRTLAALLQAGREILDHGIPNARLDLELLTAASLDIHRAALYAHSTQAVSRDAAERCLSWCRARADGWPTAYLLGRREFWSLEFQVTLDTLVPRPETENLVSASLDLLPHHGDAHIAELGTGCGAIAIALAKERPNWRIEATDLCPDALAVAHRNAQRHGVHQLIFQPGDWFQALTTKNFDLVLSNPPYVPSDDPCLKRDGLCREPRLALDGGPDGMQAIHHIAAAAPAFLKAGGYLCLEHGANQGEATRACLQRAGFRDVNTLEDLAGRPRISLGLHPGHHAPSL